MSAAVDESSDPRALRRGFTLIEVLAVIVILGILMMVLLPRLTGIGDRASKRATQTRMQELKAAIGQYEGRFGDYPPSQFLDKWGAAPNLTNMGAETLVISMWSPEWGGANLPEDKLVNTDGDEAKRHLTKFGNNQLFEIEDEWDNPIAYFHHRDYDRTDAYSVVIDETGEPEESPVKAMLNPKTKTYYEPNTFQLISAGLDGQFGTQDDLTSFKVD